MSRKEYDALVSGRRLINRTDHSKTRCQRTTSRGFCFFVGDPDVEVHRLSGIVSLDMCVTFDVDDDFLRKSYGMYADQTQVDFIQPITMDMVMNPQLVKVDEYCRAVYSIRDVRIISATDKYANLYPSRDEQKALLSSLFRYGSL